MTARREGTYLRYSANAEALQKLLTFLYAECCSRSKALKPGLIAKLGRQIGRFPRHPEGKSGSSAPESRRAASWPRDCRGQRQETGLRSSASARFPHRVAPGRPREFANLASTSPAVDAEFLVDRACCSNEPFLRRCLARVMRVGKSSPPSSQRAGSGFSGTDAALNAQEHRKDAHRHFPYTRFMNSSPAFASNSRSSAFASTHFRNGSIPITMPHLRLAMWSPQSRRNSRSCRHACSRGLVEDPRGALVVLRQR